MRIGDHAHARLLAIVFHGFPQLPRPQLGVPELLDQARLHLGGVLLLRQELEERVLQHLGDAQALDALRAPVGRDLRGMPAPELLGVPLEEHRIQLAPEPVDVEVLQIVFRQLVHHRFQIREPGFERELGAHGLQRVRAEADRVIEEMPVPVDAGDAMALEHHLVAGLRVRTARFQIMMAAELLVVVAGRALQRQGLTPPGHDAVVLGEEPVPADVHPVAVVFDGTRDAAEFAGGLEYGHIIGLGAPVLDQFPCSGESGWAAADDHHGLLLRHDPFSLSMHKTTHSLPETAILRPGYRQILTITAITAWLRRCAAYGGRAAPFPRSARPFHSRSLARCGRMRQMPSGISISDFCTSSTFTSLNVTMRTFFANRDDRYTSHTQASVSCTSK